jgi:hypothetical protein
MEAKTFIIPALLSLLVFNFFVGVLPFPLAIAEDMLHKYKPIIYYPEGDKPEKVVYSYGTKQGVACFQYWYVWSHDGYEPRPDWEPIYVYVDLAGNVYALAYRTHWQWRIKYSNTIILEKGRPIIGFLTAYHTPSTTPIGEKLEEYPIVKGEPPPEAQPTDPWQILPVGTSFHNAILYSLLTFILTSILVSAVSTSTRLAR